MLNDSTCSLLVQTQVLSWLRRVFFRDLDLFKILLHSRQFFENRVVFRFDAIES
jgi:hypothetical protein